MKNLSDVLWMAHFPVWISKFEQRSKIIGVDGRVQEKGLFELDCHVQIRGWMCKNELKCCVNLEIRTEKWTIPNPSW